MSEQDIYKPIEPTSEEVIAKIRRRTALSLPDDPSAAGLSAATIRRRFWEAICGADASVLAEMTRIINEANAALGGVVDKAFHYEDDMKKIIASDAEREEIARRAEAAADRVAQSVNGDDVFIRYSAYPDGRDYTASWRRGLNYIGVSAGLDEPKDASGYAWCLLSPGIYVGSGPMPDYADVQIDPSAEGYSTAFGENNAANGRNSFSLGSNNVADGDTSAAFGNGTLTASPSGFVTGYKTLTYPCSTYISDDVGIGNVTTDSFDLLYDGDGVKQIYKKEYSFMLERGKLTPETNEHIVIAGQYNDANSDPLWDTMYVDAKEYMVFKYELETTQGVVGLSWRGKFRGQMKVDISPDNATWTNLYTYTGTEDDQGLPGAGEYEWSIALERDFFGDGKILYVRVGDALTVHGWGGAVYLNSDVTLTVAHYEYVLKPTYKERYSFMLRRGELTPETNEHIVIAGQYNEANSDPLWDTMYVDAKNTMMFRYELETTQGVVGLSWRGKFRGQMKVDISADRMAWTNLYTYTGTANDHGLPGAGEYEWSIALDSKFFGDSKTLYIRVSDAFSSTGYGGGVYLNADVTLTVQKVFSSSLIAYRIYDNAAKDYLYAYATVKQFPHTITPGFALAPDDFHADILFAGTLSDGKSIADAVKDHATTAPSASGFATFAVGKGAHAGGYLSVAWNTACLAHGYRAKAIGDSAVAIGATVQATGDAACALGHGNKAGGQAAFAANAFNEANGSYSTALGIGTIANGMAQLVVGRYNLVDNENKYALIVGNGTDEAHRSNAFAIAWDGSVTMGSTTITEAQMMSLLSQSN